MSYHLILPYLAPIAEYIRDDSVSEIMVNPGGRVFVERAGKLHATEALMDEDDLQTALVNIARVLNGDINEDKPLLDARLPDGSRVAGTFPPASVGGAGLTIRKFQGRRFTADELVANGMLTERQRECLADAVTNEETILISGGTGTGKTTMLNALTQYIPMDERLFVIEDTSEIFIQHPNATHLEARAEIRDSEGKVVVSGWSIQRLVKHTLRNRPDRIIVGEVRGAEAFDLLQALNTGHPGSLTTLHSNSCADALTRLEACVAQAEVNLRPEAISRMIGAGIQWIVQISRERDGCRAARELVRVRGYDHREETYRLEEMNG
jgi:pilus assembly protein CpaF